MTLDPTLIQGTVSGVFGTFAVTGLKKWVPARYRSLLCLVVALIASVAYEAATGKDWVSALMCGFAGGATFTGIHEYLTKGLQGS